MPSSADACGVATRSWGRYTQLLLRQRGFVGFLGATFALGLGYSFVLPYLSLWGTSAVGFSRLEFGLFMTVTSVCAIATSTVLARWSDTRVSRKLLLLVGSAGGALGYAGYAILREPVLLLLVGVTAIALASVCFSQLFATARDWFASELTLGRDIGIALSIVRVCFSFAWTAGPAVGAVLMARHGFAGLFLGAAALYLVFFLGVWRFVPREVGSATRRTAAHLPVWESLRRPDLLGYFACFVLIFAAFTMNMMNLPLVVAQELGGTSRDLGIIFGVGPAVEIPLMLWFGHLATRGHQLALIRLGGWTTVLYFAALLLAREPWHVYPIQILSGVSFAILANVAIGFFQDLLPGQAGLATTIFANASHVGNLFGYFGFGALASTLPPRGLFAAGMVSAAIAAILLMAIQPRRGPEVAV